MKEMPPANTKKVRKAATRFAYPKGSTANLQWTAKGRKLARQMDEFAAKRLLPSLQARAGWDPFAREYRSVNVSFRDACVYLVAWLEFERESVGAEFPFARLYPVRGGGYNLCVRRLSDWMRAEHFYPNRAFDMFFFEAPSAKYWTKIAVHKTFEECVELLEGALPLIGREP